MPIGRNKNSILYLSLNVEQNTVCSGRLLTDVLEVNAVFLCEG